MRLNGYRTVCSKSSVRFVTSQTKKTTMLQALKNGSQFFCKSLKTLKSFSNPLAIIKWLITVNKSCACGPWLMHRGPLRESMGPRLRTPVLVTTYVFPTKFIRIIIASCRHFLCKRHNIGALAAPMLVRPPAASHSNTSLNLVTNESNIVLKS